MTLFQPAYDWRNLPPILGGDDDYFWNNMDDDNNNGKSRKFRFSVRRAGQYNGNHVFEKLRPRTEYRYGHT